MNNGKVSIDQLLLNFQKNGVGLERDGKTNTFYPKKGFEVGVSYGEYAPSYKKVVLQLDKKFVVDLRLRLERTQRQTGVELMIYDNQTGEKGAVLLDEYFKV